VKILKNTNVDYQWVKLEKTFFGLKKDLFICVIYNPPISSKYTRELKHDVLDCIEKDITHYNKLGNILLCADFNARISCENDFILNDESKFTPIYEDYETDKNILKRQSRDTKIDQRGKELLDLCISNQLRILNGRVLGDIFGILAIPIMVPVWLIMYLCRRISLSKFYFFMYLHLFLLYLIVIVN
jgi:hypothetical protein